MLSNINFFSPLEQFDVLPLIPFVFKSFDISITNETVILLFGFFGVFSSIYLIQCTDNTLPIIPKKSQIVF